MKKYKKQPAPFTTVDVVREFLEILYWKLSQVLDREGISMLQWAFIQRAHEYRSGIPFSQIMAVTGESKDNVRRAAARLKHFATVVVHPEDRRARKLVLTKRGRGRYAIILGNFEEEMHRLLGDRDERSRRVRGFKRLLWDASAYLVPSDLSSEKSVARAEANRQTHFADSDFYDEEARPTSVSIEDDTDEE